MISHRALRSIGFALAFAATLLPVASAKDSGPTLPIYIVQASTAAVIIDPSAGVSLSDPNANQTARKDVEAALQKWGRLQPVLSTDQADLIIVVRKGNPRLADATVGDPRQNSRPGSVIATDDAISIAVRHGSAGNAPQLGSSDADSHPQAEIDTRADSFMVYPGHADGSGSGAPGWIYVHKNALHAHDVPAVDEFRKAIDAAVKQAAQHKP